MKITDLLSIDSIEIGSSYKDKDELLKNAVKLMGRSSFLLHAAGTGWFYCRVDCRSSRACGRYCGWRYCG